MRFRVICSLLNIFAMKSWNERRWTENQPSAYNIRNHGQLLQDTFLRKKDSFKTLGVENLICNRRSLEGCILLYIRF